MQIHPQFDPIIAHIAGPLSINWYGFTYLLAFIAAFGLAFYRTKKRDDWHSDMVSDLVFYGALGVMLGGRIGYVLFYQFDKFLENPMYLVKAWEGGMSFHGGFLGVMFAMIFFAFKYKKSAFETFDFIVPCVPTGLMFGRIGNYINGELWGRVSDGGYRWLMGFPQAHQFDAQLLASNPALQNLATQFNGMSLLPRHPSQLYQAVCEGLLLFILLWWFSNKPRPRYAVTAMFLLGYAVARFMVEFFRQPDFDQSLWFGWMTKGQLLTIPMFFVGITMMWLAYRKNHYDWQISR